MKLDFFAHGGQGCLQGAEFSQGVWSNWAVFS